MELTKRLEEALAFAHVYARNSHLEFVTPELLLYAICNRTEEFRTLCGMYGSNRFLNIKTYLSCAVDDGENISPDEQESDSELSYMLMKVFSEATALAEADSAELIDVQHILAAMLDLEDSYATYYLQSFLTADKDELLHNIKRVFKGDKHYVKAAEVGDDGDTDDFVTVGMVDNGVSDDEDESDDDDDDDEFLIDDGDAVEPGWHKYVTCINDVLDEHNPLIGREKELERTIQVLCRKDKNNPLHVGEPGVGKSALIYGLAQLIKEGRVPARLKDAKIYLMDMGTMVAGTQYRGEFEERIKDIMEGASAEKNSIIYIDEIHTLIGSGLASDSNLDGSNMLKPYLEAGTIRFIGSTTYKEYNRYMELAQGIARRFQKIDINEPSKEEAVDILEGLKGRYEGFHGVVFDEGLMEYAVDMSIRYISNRFLPDKAIDLIDEAGAFVELHPKMRKRGGELVKQKVQRVSREVINDTLKRICKMTDESMAVNSDGNERLATLTERMKAEIYGQDEAITQCTDAVMLGKAGLLEDDKPIASLLFVGPTGVGKTEVCRVLARELGIELVRFDMSEYVEKHTVAKLIGSPAGYVGYEDGGLLTDAIRKTPNCVLLLDEIEKAHSDIYNILLQVMDYAQLTDNRGNKADFRNVILIMTSNAGAQFASQASVGFSSSVSRGDAMLQTVKKTFKPEFLNRLSGTVVFRDMDRHMASLILDKKLRQLQARMDAKNIKVDISSTAHDFLLEKGFTPQYGAREMDRVIRQHLNPLLMREILFGKLKQGGLARITLSGGQLSLSV